jgi:hypothetical protein
MVFGQRMKGKIKEELSRDYASLSKEELLDKKEEVTIELESSEYILETLERDLATLKELKAIMLTPETFKKIAPEFEYEKNPKYWELQLSLRIGKTDMDIKRQEDDILQEKHFIDIYKQLLAKIDVLLL